jgi:hypothetical protein
MAKQISKFDFSFPICISFPRESNRSVQKVSLCSVTDYVKKEDIQFGIQLTLQVLFLRSTTRMYSHF